MMRAAMLLVASLSGAAAFRAPAVMASARKQEFQPAIHTSLASSCRAPPVVAEVVVKEDYKVAASFAAFGLLVLVAPYAVGGPFLLLGLFLLFQTYRIRFVFDVSAQHESIHCPTKWWR